MVYNLLGLLQGLKVQFSHILEGQYLPISKHRFYAAITKERDIKICIVTEGYLHMFNQAPYPVETLKWCVYALFIPDKEWINKDCSVNSKTQYANLVVSLILFRFLILL